MNYINSNTSNDTRIILKSYCRIAGGRATLNGELFFESDCSSEVDANLTSNVDNKVTPEEKLRTAHEFFSAVYERLGVDYRKFYKMDALSKLGFLASELLLAGTDREIPKEDMGIALFNRSSSLETDSRYHKTICDKDDFFPSPAEFVYTLPNIVTGEIAIRNKIYGETAFYVMSDFQADMLCEVIENMINFAGMKRVLAGWTEVDAFTGEYSGFMVLCEVGIEANSNNSNEARCDAKSMPCEIADNLYSSILNPDSLDSLYIKY